MELQGTGKTMDFTAMNQDGQVTIVLIGDLDEDFDSATFEKLIRQGGATNKPVKIVLRDVETWNSTGISLFLQTIKTCNVPVRYAEVPHWIIIQMNFFRDFLLKNVLVESILVDCVVEGTETTAPMVLRLGKDLPILKEYPDTPIRIKRDGKIWVASLEAEDLSFISHNYDRFQVLQQ